MNNIAGDKQRPRTSALRRCSFTANVTRTFLLFDTWRTTLVSEVTTQRYRDIPRLGVSRVVRPTVEMPGNHKQRWGLRSIYEEKEWSLRTFNILGQRRHQPSILSLFFFCSPSLLLCFSTFRSKRTLRWKICFFGGAGFFLGTGRKNSEKQHLFFCF